jgi:RecA/RadA recombinase
LEPYNPASLLSARGLNTLLFSDPYAKLCFTASLASSAKTIYVDLDTTFSAYFAAGLINAKSIDVYLPSEGRFLALFQQALAKIPESSLVILDSINGLYSVYYSHYKKNERRAGGSINHMLSVFLMLLERQGVTHNVPVLATSMLRFRKEGGWKQSPASRRLLQKKSACRMQVERTDDEIILKMVEHESLPAGSSYAIKPLCL